jgi:hypothetical protein
MYHTQQASALAAPKCPAKNNQADRTGGISLYVKCVFHTLSARVFSAMIKQRFGVISSL